MFGKPDGLCLKFCALATVDLLKLFDFARWGWSGGG
jgi:hypothetical protein